MKTGVMSLWNIYILKKKHFFSYNFICFISLFSFSHNNVGRVLYSQEERVLGLYWHRSYVFAIEIISTFPIVKRFPFRNVFYEVCCKTVRLSYCLFQFFIFLKENIIFYPDKYLYRHNFKYASNFLLFPNVHLLYRFGVCLQNYKLKKSIILGRTQTKCVRFWTENTISLYACYKYDKNRLFMS